MLFRKAQLTDIPGMSQIRTSVKENRLLNPNTVTETDYVEMLTKLGKGWVCTNEGQVIGFAIVDASRNNVWALFVLPGYEGRGIGKKLHSLLRDWCINKEIPKLWLSTDPATRAEQFYQKAGWKKVGVEKNGEIRYEFDLK